MSTPSLPLPARVHTIARRFTAALLGNPNTGKTTLFNALSGLNQRVGNYPGVTVETKKGAMTCGGHAFDLIDLPGTYSLAPRSPDEMVAVDVILGQQPGEARPDVVVSIVDASNLDRNLYLTTQVLEMGVPVVVALNMIDVAESNGIKIDIERLAARLGVPVVAIQANKKRGLDDLRAAIAAAARGEPPAHLPSFPAAFEAEVAALHLNLRTDAPAFLIRRLLLDVGGYTEQCLTSRCGATIRDQVQQARQRLTATGCSVPGVEAKSRYAWIREATNGCVHRPDQRPVTWTDRLDRLLTHRLWGTLVFLLVMFLVFQAIYTGAKPLMKAIDGGKDFVSELIAQALPAGPFTSLLTEGVIGGVGAVVVFLPQILILFAFIAILEDCGYMARAAFLMDRLMSRCGLSGKSFIPLLSSVACAVPGIMATRVIEDRRDRLATILVAPLMSCSARLPVYILLIGAFLTEGYPWWMPGVVMFAMYSLGLILAPLVALVLKRTLLAGQTPAFVLEMPAYKWPSLRIIVRRLIDSAWTFLRRAGTVILASMVLVWALLNFPAGNYPQQIAAAEAPVKEARETYKKLEEEISPNRKKARSLRREEKRKLEQRAAWWEQPFHWIGLLRQDEQASQKRAAELRIEREKLEEAIAPIEKKLADLKEQLDPVDEKVNALQEAWKRQSILGRLGQAIEPAVRPLGWDWRVGVAVLASFPAREVVVSTLGIIYKQGKVDTEDIRDADDVAETDLGKALKDARWDNDPDRRVFTVPAALSLMVFFALCCQCGSTLAVIRRETRSWRWPAFTFVYMTVLACVAALVVFQVGTLLS